MRVPTLAAPDEQVGTFLDTCAVLSLYATRHMAEILALVPGRVAIAEVVYRESLYVRRIVDGESEREPVDLSALVSSGRLEVIGTEDEAELQTFIDLAAQLDDGEAMTAALAIHRSCVLVTDDRKAERLLAGRVRLQATLELVRTWAEVERMDDATMRTVLRSIYDRGYQPPSAHALRGWWDEIVGGGSTR